MKGFLYKLLLILLPVFIGCKGSDVYRGAWKAMDKDGYKYQINFGAKNFTVQYKNGVVDEFEYTQHSISIKNSTRQYGIKLKDGRSYYIIFPVADETSKGLITLETMQPLYTIGRTDYIQFDEIPGR